MIHFRLRRSKASPKIPQIDHSSDGLVSVAEQAHPEAAPAAHTFL